MLLCAPLMSAFLVGLVGLVASWCLVVGWRALGHCDALSGVATLVTGVCVPACLALPCLVAVAAMFPSMRPGLVVTASDVGFVMAAVTAVSSAVVATCCAVSGDWVTPARVRRAGLLGVGRKDAAEMAGLAVLVLLGTGWAVGEMQPFGFMGNPGTDALGHWMLVAGSCLAIFLGAFVPAVFVISVMAAWAKACAAARFDLTPPPHVRQLPDAGRMRPRRGVA